MSRIQKFSFFCITLLAMLVTDSQNFCFSAKKEKISIKKQQKKSEPLFQNSSFTSSRDNSLKRGLSALSSGNVTFARAIRDSMPSHSFDRKILAWTIAVYGRDNVPPKEVVEIAHELSGWKGMSDALTDVGERSLFNSSPPPKIVLSLFRTIPPKTAEGSLILAYSFLATGNRLSAQKIISQTWHKEKLNTALENFILQKFSSLLSEKDHRIRMENMLYYERISSAQRIAKYAKSESLFFAWSSVLKNQNNAEVLLKSVPISQRSAGYFFALSKYLRKKERFKEAAHIMLKALKENNFLINSDSWWIEQRVLSRELLDLGNIDLAYKIVSHHSAVSTTQISDAEFHAGWYALRGLKDSHRALHHFSRLLKNCKGQISRSRAFYWIGRSMEATNIVEAQQSFLKAADYPTTFYGQLASARLGKKMLSLQNPSPTQEDREVFYNRKAVRAIQRLEEEGFKQYTYRLYQEVAKHLSTPGEFSLLATMAKKHNDHFLVLKIGKIAARRDLHVGALAHPVGAIPLTPHISKKGTAIAHAIARQESEFRSSAISHAGARGMLQIMPNTAREAAQRIGIGYSPQRLTSDVVYNATLGTNIFSKKLEHFEGSYILALAAYNAGPHRAKKWIERYGDPRGKKIDVVVDWIERIPFYETRSYIQRVMENYQVYKSRLSGHFDIVHDLRYGR